MKTAPEFIPFVGPEEWIFFDDFNGPLGQSATSALEQWTFLETAAGATQLRDLTVTGGVLLLTQAANDNDVISLIANSGVKVSDLKAGEEVEFGIRFKVTDADDCDVFVGLSIQDTSIVASAPQDFVGFQIVDGSANLNLTINKNATNTSQLGAGVMADDTFARAFFRFTPTSTTSIGDVEYEIHSNGSVTQGTVASAGNFPDDVVIFPAMQFQNGAASADVCAIDWIYAKGTRNYTPGTG
jgi:hypothetical protein